MAVTATPLYGTNTAVTITLAGLVPDTNLLIGQQSTVVNNNTDLAMDAELGGKFTAGSGVVVTGRQIEIWAGASYDDGTNYSASAGATNAGLTLTAVRKAQLKSVVILPTDATVSGVYTWGGVLLSQVFGFVPRRWFLWVVHNMAATGTASTAFVATSEIKYTPIKFQSA